MFSLLVVVLMLQMLLLQTYADVSLSTSPDKIDVGSSPSLDVNCTFSFSNTTSAMVEIISLTVSRGNNTELASITDYSNPYVNVMSGEGITAAGVINPGGQSYIHLHWDNPTNTQTGTYQCVARGIDVLGHNIESVNSSVVSGDQLNTQDLMDELMQMKQTQNTLIQDLQEMKIYIAQLETKMEDQLDLSSLFLSPALSHNNKRYFVSKAPFQNYNESLIICRAYGGMLAEMDDTDEYKTVQNYLKNLTGVNRVFIGGTDEGHDGTWLLPSSYQHLPVADWCCPGEPERGLWYNCLCLDDTLTHDFRMYSVECHYDTIHKTYKYICEL